MMDSASSTFLGQRDEGDFLQCEWDESWSLVTSNGQGTSGWARILRSSGHDVPEGACRRVHLCASNPCTARWAASKYGVIGPPIHLQPKTYSEVSFGPKPPAGAPLHAGSIPSPATIDPQLRALASKSAVAGARAETTNPGQRIFARILALAREIRTPRTYVGYSFFVLVGLARKCQPCMWEGENRVNLLSTFAPWGLEAAVAECAVDGVVCCMKAMPNGRAEMGPVSAEQPLSDCRHFVACHALDHELECNGESMQAFYGRLGVVLLGTVMDGDCGIDTACMMLGLPQNSANRDALRQEIADYLLDRVEAPWLHQLLVVCAELRVEDLEDFRSSGAVSLVIDLELGTEKENDIVTTEKSDQASAVADQASAVADANLALHVPAKTDSGNEDDSAHVAVSAMEALSWSTGVRDSGVLHSLLASLPEWSIKEQILAYRDRDSKVSVDRKDCKIVVEPALWHCRTKVAEAFDDFLRSRGITGSARIPRNSTSDFVKSRLVLKQGTKPMGPILLRWHRHWRKQGSRPSSEKTFSKKMCYGSAPHERRLRAPGGGTHVMCPWVRESLYEWFVSMRYSIDWKGYNERLRSCGSHKAMGRFPMALLRQKAKQLLLDYVRQCCIAGKPKSGVALDWKWFKRWRVDYGLTMRAPNRKYKVPKALLEERLVIWWLSTVRVRTLCEECHGYDPEMENWDQTPFHRNEVGSQNAKTLAVEGAVEVPLIEGHSDTRCRWTANLTTFSNKDRILSGELPYAEFMFKADADVLQARLREHLRSCGYGPSFSAATSEKGSYREEDILEFLDRHLPAMTSQLRRWRIAMADDFGPHKTDNVFRLCWQRGYVLIPHPGGATPVSQTCDTDLNQHVRREYTAFESACIIEEMRKGVTVPKIDQTKCMDMMVKVLNNKKLHLNAADGYKRTGATVALDGTEDHMIVREAGEFFRRLNVREKLQKEIAIVRHEARAGRLKWTYEDVKKLIQPYPRREDDDVLERVGDHQQLDEGEQPYVDEEDAVAESDSDSGMSEWKEPAVAGTHDTGAGRTADSGGRDMHSAAVAVSGSPLSATAAEQLNASQHLVGAYKQAMEALKACGAVSAVQQLQNEMHKELRRQRVSATENPAVADALLEMKAARDSAELEEKLAVRDANKKQKELSQLRKETQHANELLRKRKQELLSIESILETRHAMKRYSPEALGQGKPRSGGVASRRLRYEVLDKMAKLGCGLTPAQRNDWAWFREVWDEKMCEEHAQDWGGRFSGWMQKLLDDVSDGVANAFSVFMHDETMRHFSKTPMLVVPGAMPE